MPGHVAAHSEHPADDLRHGRHPRVSFVGRLVPPGRGDIPVRNALVPAEVTLRADVVEDRIVSVGVLDEEDLVGAALLALLRVSPDVLPAEHGAHYDSGPT